MVIGAENIIGKSSLINQFLSSDEKDSSVNKLGAIINSTQKIKIDNDEYSVELIECEELRYDASFYLCFTRQELTCLLKTPRNEIFILTIFLLHIKVPKQIRW